MTDLLTPAPSIDDGRPEPPPPPPSAVLPPPPGRPRRAGRWFAAGIAGGLLLAGAAVGGFALRDDPPAASTADASSSGDPARATAALGSVHALVVAARPSVASIHTTVIANDVFGNPVQGEAAGTGFVLSADGYLVTNNHVVDSADSITVTLSDGSTESAELVAADVRSDLAVLHVDRSDLVPLPMGDSDAIQVGDPVVAIGNALDLGAEPTVTGGLVSAKDRSIPEPNGQVLVNLIQTDAAISPGNSGGPLLDLMGRVVGINTAVAGQGQNIGFAIAINPAKQLIDDLRAGTVPLHALLGVTTRPATGGTPGAEVMSIEAGSGAAAGGLEIGDVITNVGGDAIDGPESLVAAVAKHRPGDSVDVTVDRGTNGVTVMITLGAHDGTTP